jgi:hypothetical protein
MIVDWVLFQWTSPHFLNEIPVIFEAESIFFIGNSLTYIQQVVIISQLSQHFRLFFLFASIHHFRLIFIDSRLWLAYFDLLPHKYLDIFIVGLVVAKFRSESQFFWEILLDKRYDDKF